MHLGQRSHDRVTPSYTRMSSDAANHPVKVIGFQWAPAAHDVKDYLARNRVPYDWLDVERTPEGERIRAELGVAPRDLPLVIFPDGTHLLCPTDAELAERIGLQTEADHPFYDLVVVGGGPAGLAAAVYGASEGLRTIVVEREAPGGQAGTSSHIENYLGFPGGISGGEFAERSVQQARHFGVEIVAAREVTGLRAPEPYRAVRLDDDTELFCHTILLALGVQWRLLDAPGCHDLIGRGIYYGAAGAEATACNDEEVFLLGAGNSAGQAAMLLSRYARRVTLVAPEQDFAEKMSDYLIDRLQHTPNIEFRTGCSITNAVGNGRLQSITIEDVETGESEEVATSALFVFIGASPETEWLEGVLERDEQGFLLAGADVRAPEGNRGRFPLETSLPGVFVAGDVRSGSVKRVGAAVGEGSMAIQYIHSYLKDR